MSATSNRPDREGAPAPDPGAALLAGNRALESIAQQEALSSLLAFSELREGIRARRDGTPSLRNDLSQTERFVLDEVLQLICDRALSITGAHGIMIALAEGTQIICRASSGTVLVERGTQLPIDSEFLAESLVSGKIVRCDDAQTDSRIALDLVRKLGATSSILVPLRGTNSRLGVLQAFSRLPLGFTDNNARSLDLFAELVLSALKPDDQDRRINWLTDLAEQVLTRKPAATEIVVKPAVREFQSVAKTAPDLASQRHEIPVPPQSPTVESAPSAPETSAPELAVDARHDPGSQEQPSIIQGLPDLAAFGSSQPALSIGIGVAMVAALFLIGVWWGMRTHNSAADRAISQSAGSKFSAPTSPSPTANDNLMDPAKFAPQDSSTPDAGKRFPRITGIRHWSSSVGSTVVLDMDGQIPYEVHRLMSPERIYFDLRDSALASSLDGQTIEVGDLALLRVRVAQPVPGVTRLVLDTREGSNFSVSMETNPYRFVIDLRANDRALASRASVSADRNRTVAGTSEPSSSYSAFPSANGKFRIVLDAGHGGWDLGTVGRQGLMEKDLVLDVTQRLAKLLESRLGADIVFTRSTDDYLPLEQRADLANQAHADLFISVHANYSNSANARGVETYYSNFFAAPGSKEIEKRENEGVVNPVSVSLSANALQEKIEESRRLAAQVQHALYVALAPKSPDIRNRGIKDAAFVVLTGTTMPAILTEISFVSSPADEQNLQSETYRQQIAEALYKGVARYKESAPRSKIAQVQQASIHR